MNKRVVGGMVGMVVSNTHGDGWAVPDGRFNPVRAFCPELVDAMALGLSHKEIVEVIKENFPEFSDHGRDPFGLSLVWVPCGAEFRVTDYDGVEGVVYKDRGPHRYTTA